MSNRHRITKPTFVNTIHCKECTEILTRIDAQTGKLIKIQDDMFHVTCLKCSSCSRVLGVLPCHPTTSSGVMTTTTYRCLDCHRAATSPKCHACQRPTFEKCISAFDAYWHEACFKCHGCNKQFARHQYVVHEGCGYDEDCYYRLVQGVVTPERGQIRE